MTKLQTTIVFIAVPVVAIALALVLAGRPLGAVGIVAGAWGTVLILRRSGQIK